MCVHAKLKMKYFYSSKHCRADRVIATEGTSTTNYLRQSLYTASSQRTECGSWVISKWDKFSLNSKFSFSLTGYLTYLRQAGGRTDGFMPFT